MTTTEYVMISKSELNIKKNEIFMSAAEVEELIEYGDIFKKYLTKKIHEFQAQLWACKLVGKENEAYVAINTLQWIIEGIDKSWESYRQFKEEQKKKEKEWKTK